MNARIPIFHLYGGETTEGAVDEVIRHAITKMSFLHFTATADYRRRVIQMGEDPGRVFNVGSIGVENVLSASLLTKKELGDSIGFTLDRPYAVVTFHPATLGPGTAERQCKELLKALDAKQDMRFIITKANADAEGRTVNRLLEKYVRSHGDQAAIYDSLGMQRYLSAIKYAQVVIGNSSSGIIEVPSFHIPTVDIGDRQAGRIRAASVINCQPVCREILDAIAETESETFQKKLMQTENPYEGKDTSKHIAETIASYLLNREISLKKRFYDLGHDRSGSSSTM